MNNQYIAHIEIKINASSSKVWNGLTNPEMIKKYFFGTEAISDWKKGSSLNFKGVWEGKEYLDKGTILDIIPGELLKYNYFSSFSGLEDKPENYANVTYKLTNENGSTNLTVTQDNIASKEAMEHSEQNWKSVLNGLKKLLEEA